MRILISLAALFAACVTERPSAPPPQGMIVELRESFACPLPPSRGLITIARDGAVERVVFDGLGFEPGKTKTTRETMRLPQKDAAELFRLVADSGWEKLPTETGGGFSLNPETAPTCADCCSGAVFVKTTDGGRSLPYASDRKPPKLAALMSGIDKILGRFSWTPAPVVGP